MANVVLVYTGNVCSTAMIEYARLSDKVLVPIHEQFDDYIFSKFCSNADKRCEELANVLSALYRRKNCEYMDTEELMKYRGGKDIPDYGNKPHMFFKWRSYDHRWAGAEKLIEVFSENKVSPVLMVRSSLIEQALKVFLSEDTYGGRHQQFKVKEMTAEESAAYFEEQKEVHVEINSDNLEEVKKIYRGFFHRTKAAVQSATVFFPNAELRRITSEDVFKPLINYNAYNRALNEMFGPAVQIEVNAEIKLRKAGLNIENCANPELIFEDVELVELEQELNSLLEEIPSIV